MRTRRSIQINVCVSPAEMRRARARAKRETEGNVSALVRKMLFAEQAQGGASVVSIIAQTESNAEYNPAHDHSMMCGAREGQVCTCGAFENEVEQLGAGLREALREAGTLDTQINAEEVHCE